jgi:hypothetical protein
VLTTGEKGSENTQIRTREQPAFCLPSDGSGSAHDSAEMLAAGHVAKMLDADARQTRNFVFGENLLGGFNGDHCLPSSANTAALQLGPKWNPYYETAYFMSNNLAVCFFQRSLTPLNLQTARIKCFS